MAETHHCNQIIPYTDRLNYVSAMINGVGYVRTVEKMLGVEVPDRGRLVRTILSEFSRIMDHCVCIGANLVDIGALTNFIYLYQNRENIYDLIEACCGAGLTVSCPVARHHVPAVPRRQLLESIPAFLRDARSWSTPTASSVTGRRHGRRRRSRRLHGSDWPDAQPPAS
jgi:NADH:ubiquinone oxidoreductase subunit D